MFFKRLSIFMLSFIIFPILCCGRLQAQVWGGTYTYNAAQTAIQNQKGEVTTYGDCSLDESHKTQLAQAGYTAAQNALEILKQYNKLIDDEYNSPSGVCNYLKGSSSKWWDEALRSQLKYTNNDMTGAAAADKILNTQPSLTSIIVDSNSSEYAKYTDWDISDLQSQVAQSVGQAKKLSDWAASAQEGATIKADDEIVEYLKKVGVQMNKKCAFFIKLSGNSFACASKVTEAEQPDADGYCYDRQTRTVGDDSIISQTVRDCKKGSAEPADYAFSSDDYNNIEGSQKVSACQQALSKISDLRSSFIAQRSAAHQALAVVSGRLDTKCSCETDEQGNSTGKVSECTAVDDDFIEDNMEAECKTLPQYQKDFEACLVCGLVAKILGAVQRISINAFSAVGGSLIELLIIAYLIYLAYVTLITIASPEAQKISKFLTTITMQGAKVAIAILLLKNPAVIYQVAVNPILDGSVDFGLALTGTDMASIKESASQEEYTRNFDHNSEYLSAITLENLVGATENFSKEATILPAIGRSFICYSWRELGYNRAYLFPRFGMLFQGIIMLIFGFGILLAIGFYILDCTLQLGLVAALMAFFIASWPFKMTAGYTKKGWDMLMNTFFCFVMMSVIIKTINTLVLEAVSLGMSQDELQQKLNGDQLDALNDKLDVFGIQMLVLIVCCMLAYKLSTEAGRLANSFASGAPIKLGADLGGLAGDTAKKLAIGSPGAKGPGGNKQGIGGAAGLIGKGVGGMAGSIAENTGAKGAIRAMRRGNNQGGTTTGFNPDNNAGGNNNQDGGNNNNQQADQNEQQPSGEDEEGES